jgi:hypothetical protein
MPVGGIQTLFLDTSSLRRAGFQSPDLRKLLVRCREQSLRVVVSHIAWEEWRTQLLEKALDKVRSVQTAFDLLKSAIPSNFILSRLPTPALAVWDEPAIDAASTAALHTKLGSAPGFDVLRLFRSCRTSRLSHARAIRYGRD